MPPGEGDLILQLYELLEGRRAALIVYSQALQQAICFVNPALQPPNTVDGDLPVYTTRELAFILTLSPEEFRRFHYLKARLVG